MNRATWLQDRRMQKFRDVLSRWEAGELGIEAQSISLQAEASLQAAM